MGHRLFSFCIFLNLVVFSNAILGKLVFSSKTIGSPRFEAIIIFSVSGITPINGIPRILITSSQSNRIAVHPIFYFFE